MSSHSSDSECEDFDLIKLKFLPKMIQISTIGGFVMYNHDDDVETFRLATSPGKKVMLRVSLRRMSKPEGFWGAKPVDEYQLL